MNVFPHRNASQARKIKINHFNMSSIGFTFFQINYQESMSNQTFLHSLLESTMRSEDVEKGVFYLLTNGANVMLKSQFQNENIVLPVHVAVKMQIDPVIKANFEIM